MESEPGLHLARIESAAFLNEAIGQCRFAVVNMSNMENCGYSSSRPGLGQPSIIPVGGDERGSYYLFRV